MKLSDKIAQLRKEQGWSQEQLAIKLDVSRQAVYKWEADINQPDLDKLRKISSLFGISFNDLMDDEIDLPSSPGIVKVENEEIPEVEVLENTNENQNTKTVHNEVAVQINCVKENPKKTNKKLVVSLCVLASIIVICLCTLSYILFGIVLQKDSYLVKFDTQGGEKITDLIIKEGKKIDPVSITKEGYTFDGWYIGDKKWDFNTDKIKGNVTLVAKWTPNQNTIIYIDGESGNRYESQAKTDETVVLLTNTFTKIGYTFSGWSTVANGEVVYANCATLKMGSENLTLYAVWKIDEYTLTLNKGKGTISDTYPQKFTANDSIVLPIPTLSNHTFDGWYDQSGTKIESIEKGTLNDITLTARYTPIKYTITYVLNGGTNDEDNPTEFTVGEEVYLFDPMKEDASFGGWYYDADFTIPADEESLTELGKNRTLYAKFVEEHFEFMEVSDGYALVEYVGGKEFVVIPNTYLGKKVVEISAGAFYANEYMCEVFIPSNVKRIDITAFDECYMLTTITVEDSNSNYSSIDGVLFNEEETWLYKYPMGREDTVYNAPRSVDVIGPYAFAYAIYLEEIYLPDDIDMQYGIGKVCESAFEGCISLRTIELGYIANYFEPRCFANCWSLEKIEFKADTIWGIGANAFENCMLLEEVTILSGAVVEIGKYAFKGCISLDTFDLSTVEKLSEGVFAESGLTELYIPMTVSYVGNLLFIDCLYDLTVYCEASSQPSEWAYNWSFGAYEVVWNANREDIEPLVKFLYEIRNGAVVITGCVGEGVITVPYTIDGYTVKQIDPYAFSGNINITEIIIPSNVSIIDMTAFEECPSLQTITYLGTNYTEYRSVDGVLYGDYGRAIVKYPEGKTDTEFTVPYNVDIIRKYAFKNNPHLTKITLPSDITGDNYVGKIEQGGFENCVALETVEGCAVGYFDKEAFKDCISLKEMTFLAPEISFIMNQVFLNCVSLESITFKGNVGIINWQSFGYCSNLTNITFEGTLEKLGWGCFEGCESLTGIVIPEGTTVIGGQAFKECYNLKRVTIPSTVTTIEEHAFYKTSIEEIFIPATVTTIGKCAFEDVIGIIIFCEAETKPEGYDERWDVISTTDEEESSRHTVYWNQTYSPFH